MKTLYLCHNECRQRIAFRQRGIAFLDNVLETLTERELAIVILHYHHGVSHKEISEKMHLSYANVRQLCYVVLKKLRKEMEK